MSSAPFFLFQALLFEKDLTHWLLALCMMERLHLPLMEELWMAGEGGSNFLLSSWGLGRGSLFSFPETLFIERRTLFVLCAELVLKSRRHVLFECSAGIIYCPIVNFLHYSLETNFLVVADVQDILARFQFFLIVFDKTVTWGIEDAKGNSRKIGKVWRTV